MRKNKPTIILDADDVLFACNSYSLRVMEKKTGKKLDLYRIDRWGLLGETAYAH